MKNFFTLTIFLVLVAIFGYAFRAPFERSVRTIVYKLQELYIPCSRPIAYSVGTLDEGFGLSEDELLRTLSAAEKIWEKAAGRDLFAYTPDGSLTVNLIYDYRQEATSKMASLGLKVEETKASYDELNAKYKAMKTEMVEVRAEYDTQLAAFMVKKEEYDRKVEALNSKGGATRKEISTLERERVVLQNELAELQVLQDKGNEYVDDLNSIAVVLNHLARILNLGVDEYNNTAVTLGEEFGEGLFTSDRLGQRIDIYEFGNIDKLTRVLAHELGHALGLDHIDDPEAIMYRLNKSSNIEPTASDVAILKTRCGLK